MSIDSGRYETEADEDGQLYAKPTRKHEIDDRRPIYIDSGGGFWAGLFVGIIACYLLFASFKLELWK